MFELLILLFTVAVVYGLAWGAARASGRLIRLPAAVQEGLPWLLFHLHLTVGLWVLGDLSDGAAGAVVRLLLLAAAGSLGVALLRKWVARLSWQQALLPWLAAGTAPWAVALVVALLPA